VDLVDLVGFRVRLCDFMSASSDQRLSSCTRAAALVRWFIGVLAWQLPICVLQQALQQQDFPDSDDGGARTAARASVCSHRYVIQKPIYNFITIGIFILLLMIIDRSMELSQKKQDICTKN
jgi:hypothetical protein